MASGVASVWMPVDDMRRALQFYGETPGSSVGVKARTGRS